MNPRAPYEYQPLIDDGHIRLLELQPDEESALLTCRLISAHIDEAPPYEALSYTWGQSSNLLDLYHVSNGPGDLDVCLSDLKITKNLHEALVQLRSRVSKRKLWVDAICIDQANIEERGKQVQIMRKIYTTAVRVLVWLGPAEPSTSVALQTITMLIDHCNSTNLPYHALQEITDEDPYSNILGLDAITVDQNSISALGALFSRAWFQRIWVVQEVSAGGSKSQVLIGHHMVPWDHLGAAALYLEALRWASPTAERVPGQRNALVMWQRRLLARETPPTLLDEARQYAATDMRDKVYALLGFPAFQRLVEQFGLKVDYTKDFREVYRLITVLAIKSSQTLEILSYVDHSHTLVSDVEPRSSDSSLNKTAPSWVARWDIATPYMSFPLHDYAQYRDRTNGTCSIAVEPDKDTLQLNGLCIGSVLEVAQHLDWTYAGSELVLENPDALAHFWEAITRRRDLGVSEDDLFAGLSHAMTNGIDADYGPSTRDSARHVADCIAFLLPMFSCESPIHSSSPSVSSFLETLSRLQQRSGSGDGSRFSQDVAWICTSRRLFLTDRGHIGLGPATMQEKDVVTILFGGHTPFLLRPTSGYYELVSEIYVQNLMDGEAMEEWKAGRLLEQTFILR